MTNIMLMRGISGYARQLIEQIKSQGKLTICDFETVAIHRAEPPQITQQLPTKQPRRKTGVAQARRIARKRRNRK